MRESHEKRIEMRIKLWKQQKECCVYCGKKIPLKQASVDHVIPVEHLDENIGDDNLVVACFMCNKRKGSHIVFTNLYDKVIYPILDIPYFFQYNYITYNKKDKK